MEIKKKDVKKIKNATKEEMNKLQDQYKTVSKSVGGMSPLGLAIISLAGIFVVLYFSNKFLVLVGLLMIFGSLYVFIRRGAHREGYFEGYYEMMTKLGSRDERETLDKTSDKSDKSSK